MSTFDYSPEKLKDGKDYYINEEGKLVFTATYHLKRGHCCQSGCLHCPYEFGKTSVNKAKDERC